MPGLVSTLADLRVGPRRPFATKGAGSSGSKRPAAWGASYATLKSNVKRQNTGSWAVVYHAPNGNDVVYVNRAVFDLTGALLNDESQGNNGWAHFIRGHAGILKNFNLLATIPSDGIDGAGVLREGQNVPNIEGDWVAGVIGESVKARGAVGFTFSIPVGTTGSGEIKYEKLEPFLLLPGYNRDDEGGTWVIRHWMPKPEFDQALVADFEKYTEVIDLVSDHESYEFGDASMHSLELSIVQELKVDGVLDLAISNNCNDDGGIGEGHPECSSIQSQTGTFQASLSDMYRLTPGQYLNDEVINFYMHTLQTHVRERAAQVEGKRLPPRVHISSTFFYTQLDKSVYSSVQRWSRPNKVGGYVPLADCQIILVPINIKEANHWVLGIIDTATKSVCVYNSLSGYIGVENEILNKLLTYIESEAQDIVSDYPQRDSSRTLKSLKNPNHQHMSVSSIVGDMNDWRKLHINKPMQGNFVDCGVYVCKYAYCICYGFPVESFTGITEPDFRRRIAYDILEANN